MSDTNLYVPVPPTAEESPNTYSYRGDPRQGAPISAPRVLFYAFLVILSAIAIIALVFSSILWGRQTSGSEPSTSMPTSSFTILQIVDGSHQRVSSVGLSLQCLTPNHYEVILQFPLINFQIPSGGGTLKQHVSTLPSSCSPRHRTTFSLSTNDPGIHSLSDFTLPTATLLPVAVFEGVLGQDGSLEISLPGGVLIPAGSHTINSQSITYVSDQDAGFPSDSNVYTTLTFPMEYTDGGFFPLTQIPTFPLDVSMSQSGSHVRLTVPTFTFSITSAISPLNPYQYDVNGQNGQGGLKAQTSPMPSALCPSQIQTVTQLTSSGVGLSLSLDTYCKLWVMGSNTVYFSLPYGNYTFYGQDLTYLRTPEDGIAQLNHNRLLQPGFTNIVSFTKPEAQNYAFLDAQNDFYDGVITYIFSSNALQPDQTNNAMDIFVAVGKTRDDGTVDFANGGPQRIFTGSTNLMGSLPTIAISRKNKHVIVATFASLNFNVVPLTGNAPGATGSTNTFLYCVSTDEGHTWSAPAPITGFTTGIEFDVGGVLADQYGNFLFTVLYTQTLSATENQAVQIFLTADNAHTWVTNSAWQTTNGNGDFSMASFFFYDGAFGVAMGNDGTGQYGLWASGSAYVNPVFDCVPWICFLPITGLGLAGALQQMTPPGYINLAGGGAITVAVSEEGRLFSNNWALNSDASTYGAQVLLEKAPGAFLPSFIEGPRTIYNGGMQGDYSVSQPGNEGQGENALLNGNGLAYDNLRQVLFSMSNEQPEVTSQDFYLTLVVSFDFGTTFSRRIAISDSHLHNRGDGTMAFDPVRGGLSFSWHDGRNDPTMQSTQYYYDIWSPCKVDSIVGILAQEMGFSIPASVGVSC